MACSLSNGQSIFQDGWKLKHLHDTTSLLFEGIFDNKEILMAC